MRLDPVAFAVDADRDLVDAHHRHRRRERQNLTAPRISAKIRQKNL